MQGAEAPLRHTHHIAEQGTVLLMPAWRAGRRFGIKTVSIFAGNGARGLPAVHAVYALFDASTGVPLALLDGTELTARRTAAVSALAADFLARPDAQSLLLVGAGRVAALLPDALRTVRPGLCRITVWNRSPVAALALAGRLRLQGHAAVASTDLESAVRQADIVSCATLSTQPLVRGSWLAPGVHLDLIGGYTPQMREADGACFARGQVFVDTDEALDKCGDLLGALAEGCFERAALQGTLSDLCRGLHPGRGDGSAITVFKSVGSALADLAAAELAIDADGGGAQPSATDNPASSSNA